MSDPLPVTQKVRVVGSSDQRTLAGAFDALVRAAMTQPDQIGVFAQRTHDLWKAQPALRFEVHAGALSVDGAPVLTADEQRGRWLLPSFMSGLSSLGLGDGDAIDGLGLLAAELAALTLDEARLQEFANWIWSGGADGLDLRVQPGILEVGSVREVTERRTQSDQLRAVRAQPLVGDDGVQIGGSDLDRAVLREEFQAPLDLFQKGAAVHAFRTDHAEITALRRSVDDERAWMELELSLAVDGPEEVRRQLPMRRLGASIVSRLRSAPGTVAWHQLLERALQCRSSTPEVWTAMLDADLLSAVGAGIAWDRLELLKDLQDENGSRSQLARALLQRAHSKDEQEAIATLPVQWFLEDVTVLEVSLTALVAVFERDALAIRAIVDATPPAIHQRIFRCLETARLDAFDEEIAAVVLRDPLDSTLASLAAEGGGPKTREVLIGRVMRRQGRTVSPQVLRVLARLLLDHDDVADAFVQVVNHAFCPHETKTALLGEMARHPSSRLARAGGVPWGRFEAPAVRAARLTLRRRGDS